VDVATVDARGDDVDGAVDVRVTVADEGPGIPDIEWAMQEGHSTATPEMRERGFGAGLGLPNIRKNSDEFAIESTVGTGTTLRYAVRISP
jgi:anti-sigma regulatory factor (Ser/Thr protein kinase)